MANSRRRVVNGAWWKYDFCPQAAEPSCSKKAPKSSLWKDDVKRQQTLQSPHPRIESRLANTQQRRRLTRRTLPAEFKSQNLKLETKMAWHVPVWALSARRTPYKIGAARGGTTWPPPTNGIDACMFCSAFLRADGDERLGCFQNQPWTSRSYRLRLTPDIEQILL